MRRLAARGGCRCVARQSWGKCFSAGLQLYTHVHPPTHPAAHTPLQDAAATAAGQAGTALIRPEALDESRIEDLIGEHLQHNLEIFHEQVGQGSWGWGVAGVGLGWVLSLLLLSGVPPTAPSTAPWPPSSYRPTF